MSRLYKLCLMLVAFGLLSAESVWSQIGTPLATGRYGTPNTFSAYSNPLNNLSLTNKSRVYVSAGKSGFSDPLSTVSGGLSTINLWNLSNMVSANIGLHRNFDLIVGLNLYQDLNYRTLSDDSNLPDDFYVMLRSGGYGFGDGKFNVGGAATVRLPTGTVDNVPLEVYKSGSPEFGVMGLFSVFGNPYFKDEAYRLNLNLGFWFHNDAGNFISPFSKSKVEGRLKGNRTVDEGEVQDNAAHIGYGLGFMYPTGDFDLGLDLYGIFFITEPHEFVYSRENFTYVTPSFKYRPFAWLDLGLYMDIKVTPATEDTDFENGAIFGIKQPGGGDVKLPGGGVDNTSKSGLGSYPGWRVGLTTNFNILPLPTSRGTVKAQVEKERQKFIKELLLQDQGAKDTEEKLNKLKEIRQQAEDELDKIKEILEEEDNE